MPIRDMDNYYVPNHPIKIAANRGANGIDGTISSAFGMAMTGKPTTLLTGDLTLFHDMNGLMLSHQAHVPLTIVVVNNQGGGIFSFLPQAAAKAYFEPMFGTPLPIVIERIARLYDAEYKLVDDLDLLYELVHKPATRLRIIEVKSNREQNVVAHQKLTQAIKEALL
jgi:2-succinyl-5-enolpyruvyl-6-hydroxy-3-cyclohexene-1-carboxylate synthase